MPQRGLGIPLELSSRSRAGLLLLSPRLLLTLALIHQSVETIGARVLPSLASGLAVLGLVVLLDPKHLIHEAALSVRVDLEFPSLVALTKGEVEGDGSKETHSLVIVRHSIKLSANVA